MKFDISITLYPKTMDISTRSRKSIKSMRESVSGAGTDYRQAAVEIFGILVELAKDLVDDQRRSHTVEKEYLFFQSWTACTVYCNVILSLLLGRPKLLYGCVVVMLLQISWILVQWTVYILDDDRLWKNIDYWQSWIKLILRDGETILNQQSLAKHIAGGTVLLSSHTTSNYWRAIYRYKCHQMNTQAARMVTTERYQEQVEQVKQRLKEMRDSTKGGADQFTKTFRKKSKSLTTKRSKKQSIKKSK